MSRDAPADHRLHPFLRQRHSPRAFSDRPVPAAELRSVLEAARWAPSAFNEQPWRWIVATREVPEDHARLLGCLGESNQRWAQAAPVLMLTVAQARFSRNEESNRHALHDVGLAMGQAAVQATALGLVMHQMAGFDRERARAVFAVPEAFEPVAAVALGYPGDPAALPENLAAREGALRVRRPQEAQVFSGRWGAALRLPGEQPWDEVLGFWFGALDAEGLAHPAKVRLWWTKDPDFDALIRERFGDLYAAVRKGERAAWLGVPRGRLAAIVALDQFGRNMFRGSGEMFAADPLALRLSQDGVDAGMDAALAPAERAFFYMPLMHSEDLADQDRCVALFARLAEEALGAAQAQFAQNHAFAVKHRDIVARFGRFPHRNASLGRPSTADEEAFLQGPGSSF